MSTSLGLESESRNRDLNRLADHLVRLEHSRDEVETILAMAPENSHLLAVDFLAGRETFTKTELGDFRILRFATRALPNQDHPELSSLVLSLVDERGEARKGLLHAFEISRLRLPVELVILSASQTGLGRSVPGEGMLGSFLASVLQCPARKMPLRLAERFPSCMEIIWKCQQANRII